MDWCPSSTTRRQNEMPECHNGRGCRESFVVAPYYPGADQRLRPKLPRSCPWRDEKDAADNQCTVSEHHMRRRRTGPDHELMVAQCGTHGHSFTIYPPGFAPYLRRPVVGVTPDGSGVCSDGVRSSLFEGAQDAADGEAWRPSGPAYTTGRWRTQQRHIQLGVQLLGLDAEAPDATREQIAHHLAVPLLDLARAPPQNAGFRVRGRRVMEVFARLQRTMSLPKQLLRCGSAAGLWPAPAFV